MRNRLGTLAGEAVADFNFTYVPGALTTRFPVVARRPMLRTLNGIDVLVKNGFAPLKGKTHRPGHQPHRPRPRAKRDH